MNSDHIVTTSSRSWIFISGLKIVLIRITTLDHGRGSGGGGLWRVFLVGHPGTVQRGVIGFSDPVCVPSGNPEAHFTVIVQSDA